MPRGVELWLTPDPHTQKGLLRTESSIHVAVHLPEPTCLTCALMGIELLLSRQALLSSGCSTLVQDDNF